jgi:hypothetical protein
MAREPVAGPALGEGGDVVRGHERGGSKLDGVAGPGRERREERAQLARERRGAAERVGGERRELEQERAEGCAPGSILALAERVSGKALSA